VTEAPVPAPQVVWVDGGLSTALERRGWSTAHELWTARVLVDAPWAVVAEHRRFLDAGARVVLTASYQAGLGNLTRYLGSPTQAHRVLASSVACARRAVAESGVTGARVAASLGAYGALLADGSEYHGRYDVPWHRVAAEQRQRLEVLLDAGPDIVVCETVPTLTEAEMLFEVLEGLDVGSRPVEVWVTFTAVDDAMTAGGDELGSLGSRFPTPPWLAAVGVNCTHGAHVAAALRALAQAFDGPLVAEPNAGGAWDAARARWEGVEGVDVWYHRIPDWVGLGARYIGGCCGVGPEELAAIIASSS